MRVASDRALAALLALLALGAGAAAAGEPRTAAPRQDAEPSPGEIQAQPPPFSEGIFPCSQCHDRPGDPTRRELGFHDDVQGMFRHDSRNRWCLDCHDNQNRDVLRLASGAHVPFTESYRLCGQCHGDKYRDWRAGVHGKRVGMWNGQKTYYLCVNCHNPHSPRFQPLKPEPRPARPEEMKR
jgi:cytochrome c553